MEVFAVLRVRLIPKGGRNALTGWVDGVLSARVSAPPIDGAANKALIEMLSDKLAVSKSKISILSGETSRNKLLRIEGVTSSDLEAKLALLLIRSSKK